MAESDSSSDNLLIHEIQKVFPRLYSNDAKTRLSTASKLLEIISKNKEKPLDDVFYSVVERLIKGTTQPKDSPKIGSTVLLTEILHSFSNFRISKLLEMCKKIIGDVNDELKVDGVTGWTLIFTSIIQSNRLDISEKKTLKELIRFMVQLGVKKPLSNIAICNIFEMLFDRQFDPEAFSSILKSSLKLNEHGDASPFHLYLILLIHKHPELSRVLDHIPIVDLDDPDNLIQYIEATIPYHPSIHPACVELFRHIDENNRMEVFWKPVFNDPLFGSDQSHKHHRYGLSFLSSILPFLNESNASYVFSKQMMNLWMQGLTNRQSRFHSVAMQLSKDLVANYDTYDGALQSTIISLLTESPGTVSFDDITQTKTVSQLYFKTKPEAVEILVDRIIEKIRSYEAASARDKMRSLFVGQLRDLMKSDYIFDSSELKLTVLNFFLAHGYFDVSNDETLNLVTPATDSLITKIQFLFFKLIGSCSTNPDVMEGVGLHALQLIKGETPLKDEKTAPLWKKMKKMKIKFKKLKASGEYEKQLSIFKPLFFGMAISSFQDSSQIETLIANFDELVECFKRALGDGQEENEPKWPDVLLDLMISQFPVQSPFLSSVMVKAFRLFVSDVTLEGLEQLKIALLVDKFDEDGDVDEEEEEEEAADEGKNEQECESTEKPDEESEGEESDVPEDDDEDVDDEFRAKVTLALGPAAAVGDETESPIDDEEMFQLDEALSEAFRSKYSTDKHTQATLKTLRSKCLDLVEIIFKSKEQSLERVLFLVPVLIDAIKLYSSSKEIELRARVSKLFMLLPNCKSFGSYDAMNVKVAQTLFKKGINMASKIDNAYIQASAAKICVWVMSISKHIDLNTDWAFDHLLKLLQEYFSKPNSFVSKEFFMIIFQNHKIFNSQILEALSKSVFINLRPFKKLGGLTLINAYLRQCQNDIVEDKAIEACLHSIKRDALIGLESAVNAKRSALTTEYRRLIGTLNKFIPSQEQEVPKKTNQQKKSNKEKMKKQKEEEETENVEMETETTKEEDNEKEIAGETPEREEKMETEKNEENEVEVEDKEMEDEKQETEDESKGDESVTGDNNEIEAGKENEEKSEIEYEEEKLGEQVQENKEEEEVTNEQKGEEKENEDEEESNEAKGKVEEPTNEENENENKIEENSENDEKNECQENINDKENAIEEEEKEEEKVRVNGEVEKDESQETNEKTENEDDKEENEVKRPNDHRSPKRLSVLSGHSNSNSPSKKSRRSIDKTPTSPKPSTSSGLSSGKKSKPRTPTIPSSMLDENVNKLMSLHIDQKEEEPVVKRIKFEPQSASDEDSPPTIRLTRSRVKTPRVIKTAIKPEPETAEEQLEADDDLPDFSVPRVQIIKTPTTRSRARSATPTKETPTSSATTPLRRSLRTRK